MATAITTTSGKFLLVRLQDAGGATTEVHICKERQPRAAQFETLCGLVLGGTFTTYPGRRSDVGCKLCKRRLGKG